MFVWRRLFFLSPPQRCLGEAREVGGILHSTGQAVPVGGLSRWGEGVSNSVGIPISVSICWRVWVGAWELYDYRTVGVLVPVVFFRPA